MLHSSKICKKSKIFPTNIKQRLIPIAILSGLLVLTYIAASYFSKPASPEQAGLFHSLKEVKLQV